MKMGNGVLILISVLAFASNVVMTRYFQLYVQKNKIALQLYQAIFVLTGAIAFFAAGLWREIYKPQMLLPAAFMGTMYAIALLFCAKCYEMGKMSLTSVIVNMSLLMPVLYSWFVVGEQIYLGSVIGLALISVTMVLSALSSRSQSGGNHIKWIVCVMIAFVANGLSIITQKYYQLSYGKENAMLFMAVCYSTAAIVFLAIYLRNVCKTKENIREQVSSIKKLIVVAVCAGAGSFGGNAILVYLCTAVNGGILYPCMNGGVCITVALASFFLFKEPVFKMKVVALVIGVAAIVMLNI